jgi:hypothetical protein
MSCGRILNMKYRPPWIAVHAKRPRWRCEYTALKMRAAIIKMHTAMKANRAGALRGQGLKLSGGTPGALARSSALFKDLHS